MALSAPSGFAIRRNGDCLSSEVDCGQTIQPFRACCPAGGSCPKQYNVDCCPSPANCTQALLEKPNCANSTWTLYDNSGYFCCAPGTIGYGATATGSDGCADPGFPPDGAILLSVISAGQTTTSSSVPSAASSATSSLSPSISIALPRPSISSSASPSPSGSSSDSGAIAGGVVGGVTAVASALLISIWYFRKRKSKARSARSHLEDNSRSFHVKDATSGAGYINEADSVAKHELLVSKKPTPAMELQDTSKQLRTELQDTSKQLR